MPRRDLIKRNGQTYTVYAPDEVLLNEEIRCPRCNSADYAIHGEEMVQHGIETDVMWEFIKCADCQNFVCIRSEAPALITESYLAQYIDWEIAVTHDIPF